MMLLVLRIDKSKKIYLIMDFKQKYRIRDIS